MAEKGTIELPLRRQKPVADPRGRRGWRRVESVETWRCRATALVLCDVWDRHWCRASEERLAALLPRMNEVAHSLRNRGVLVVHAPSDTMDFYAGAPARRRAGQAPVAGEPPERQGRDIPLPVDAGDGGCDVPGCFEGRVWSRQHPAIEIDQTRDLISDSGRELYNVYQHRRITGILIMGVHANICILDRSFAIKQMTRWGFRVALLRDLTDSMYNPERPPYVSHSEGTRLVIGYIEKFWCPTVDSSRLG